MENVKDDRELDENPGLIDLFYDLKKILLNMIQ